MYLLSEIIEFITCVLFYLYAFLFADRFLKRSAKYHWWLPVIFSVPCIFLSWYPISNKAPNLISFLYIFIEFTMICLCFVGIVRNKFLLLLIFHAVDLLLANTISSLLQLFSGCPVEELAYQGSVLRIIYLFLLYLTEAALIYFIYTIRQIPSWHFNGSYRLISGLVFFSCDFVITFLVYYLLTHNNSDEQTFIFFCVLINLMIFVLSVAGLFLVLKAVDHQVLKAENMLLKVQIDDQKHLLHEQEEKYTMLRTYRHDMKSYLTNYRFLLSEGRSQEVIESINEILDGPLETIDCIYTANGIINSLIYSKMATCHSNGIIFNVRIQIDPAYRNTEFMVLLSNLLDNAIEAELKEPPEHRSIYGELIEENNSLSLILRNHISSSVLLTNADLHSTKSQSEEHGLGWKSIKQIIQNLGGIYDIYEEQNYFYVQILIPTVQ